MTIEGASVQQLTQEVLESVVGMPSFPSISSTWAGREDYVSGSVKIGGSFTGVVVVHCTALAARRMVSMIFETAEDAATAEDIKDVLRELANVVGGHLKGMLPGPAQLSLPLADTTAHAIAPSRGALEAWLECGGEPVVVKIFSRELGGERAELEAAT